MSSSTSWPALKNFMVGMLIIWYFADASSGCSSTLTLPTLTLPLYSSPICSMRGERILQGPHHSAQKSTITGMSDFNTSASKLSLVKTTCAMYKVLMTCL